MIPAKNRKDIISYRKERALSLLDEVKILIDLNLANSAVNRMYYACYHAVSALLLSREIDVKTHKGLRQVFGAEFIRKEIIPIEEGRLFNRIYDKRQECDYDDFRDISIAEVIGLQPKVEKFVEMIFSKID